VRSRDWEIDPPRKGLIIQEVTRTFHVDEWDPGTRRWEPLDDIDGYIQGRRARAFADITRYWELWTVDSRGRISDGGGDTFSLCSIIPGTINPRTGEPITRNTTRGTFRMTGEAVFYPTDRRPEDLGFRRSRENHPAGGLYYRGTDPSAYIDAYELRGSRPEYYSVTVAWNSRDRDAYSRVTER
jgi:hypothetical protein